MEPHVGPNNDIFTHTKKTVDIRFTKLVVPVVEIRHQKATQKKGFQGSGFGPQREYLGIRLQWQTAKSPDVPSDDEVGEPAQPENNKADLVDVKVLLTRHQCQAQESQ